MKAMRKAMKSMKSMKSANALIRATKPTKPVKGNMMLMAARARAQAAVEHGLSAPGQSLVERTVFIVAVLFVNY